MNRLALHLLGAPEVMRDNEPVTGFRSTKARALLFYVAASQRPQARTKLAALLWGDFPDENANANLRKTLTNLRKVAGPHLAITRDAVAVDPANPLQVDLHEFESAVVSGNPVQLRKAVDLYQGEFLEGFYVRRAPDFETWQLSERQRLRERLLGALEQLAHYETQHSHFDAAIAHAQRLVAIEPLREDAHRLLMSLFAQHGQRARALAQYEVCVQALTEELGVEPGEETTRLFEQIRDDLFVAPHIGADALSTPRHNIPAPLTSFVDRDEELSYIERWLSDATGRLLTITGYGGVGKTRLAQHAAWKALDKFTDGVWTVSLTPAKNISELAMAVVGALNISFLGRASPELQVVRFLRRKELLLLLDNAEHLVSQALADFLVEILTQAAAVKIVVTSRQQLEMQAERVLPLSGLPYPQEDIAATGSSYPAAQLLRERVESQGQSVPARASLDRTIRRLCQVVDGLPLALELTAAWANTLSLEETVSRIEGGLEGLTTNLRDLPPRHRSVEAVFETSWKLLSGEEQHILQTLAYFRGGFSAAGAAQVAGASSAQLQALANKSLLQPQGSDRYDMHPLIRQYAAGKLAEDQAQAQAVARRHSHYFSDFLARREEAIQGAEYLQAKAQIEADAANIRKAWDWAVGAQCVEDIARSIETLHYYFLNTQGLFNEAARRFQHAALQIAGQVADGTEPLVGRLLLKAAVNRRLLGELEEASRLAEESLSHFYQQERPVDIARATSTLAVIRLQQNKKANALQLAESAVEEVRALDEPVALCLCLNNFAYVLAPNGNHEEAVAVAEESAALARAINYPHGELSALNMLGVYYQQGGEDDKAERIFEELVVTCRKSGTKSRLAQAVNNLGALYKKRGEPHKAQPLLQEAIDLYKVVGQVHYAAFVEVILGEIAVEQGNYRAARDYYRKAVRVARTIEMPALTLNALVLAARLFSAEQKHNQAVSILAFVCRHPATFEDTRGEASDILHDLRELMSPEAFAIAEEQATGWTLNDVAEIAF